MSLIEAQTLIAGGDSSGELVQHAANAFDFADHSPDLEFWRSNGMGYMARGGNVIDIHPFYATMDELDARQPRISAYFASALGSVSIDSVEGVLPNEGGERLSPEDAAAIAYDAIRELTLRMPLVIST